MPVETCTCNCTSLFTKQGNLNGNLTFHSFSYTWKSFLSFSENHEVPAIDWKLQCLEMRKGEFLSVKIELLNETTSEKQEFSHVFDRQRSSFCFRRMVTGVKHVRDDGQTIVSFPIDRFLKTDEIDEEYEASEQKKWPFYAPFTWKVLEDGRIEGNSVKTCFNRFDFRIILSRFEKLTALPEAIDLPKWPKGNGDFVHCQFVEPVWPDVRARLSCLKEGSSPEDRRKIIDLLGIYYHQWTFDEETRNELEEWAHSVGFLRIMNGVVLEGGYSRMMASLMTSDICKKQSEENAEDVTVFEYEDTLAIEVSELATANSPWTFEIGHQSMQWNVHVFRSEYHDTEFLSVAAMIIGAIRGFRECSMDVSVTSPSGTFTSSVRRRLNRVQNTMFIPTFCRIDQLDLEMEVKLKLRMEPSTMKKEEASDSIAMPGLNDVLLKVEEKLVAVNKHFLAHHSKFLESLFFNTNFEEHKLKTVEICSTSHDELLYFLDALYHGTKLYKVWDYYQTLRKADEWICERVLRILAKGVKNTKCLCVNKRKLKRKFQLELTPEEANEYGFPLRKKIRIGYSRFSHRSQK